MDTYDLPLPISLNSPVEFEGGHKFQQFITIVMDSIETTFQFHRSETNTYGSENSCPFLLLQKFNYRILMPNLKQNYNLKE